MVKQKDELNSGPFRKRKEREVTQPSPRRAEGEG